MPLKLYRKRGSPNWYIRGTVRGITVDESSKVAAKSDAETIRARREWECLQASVFGRKTTRTFLEATVAYMEAGGERRFLAPLIKHFGTTPLADIDQTAIDRAAKTLYPSGEPSTLNRQVYTPVSAVLKFAAKRGMCEFRQIDRPRQPKGRVRWLTSAEADRLIGACSAHLKPLIVFLLYTGCRLSEGLYLDWAQVDLKRGEVQFLKTKNGDARGVPLHPRAIAVLSALPTVPALYSAGRTASHMPVRTTAADRSRLHLMVHAGAQPFWTSRRTTADTHGQPGTTPQTAISCRSCTLAGGKAKRWFCATRT